MYKFDRSLDFVRSIKNVTIDNDIAVDEDKFHDFWVNVVTFYYIVFLSPNFSIKVGTKLSCPL